MDRISASQASSHFALEPVSGARLFDMEMARRASMRRKGAFRAGCKEIDEYVLLGGLERGCVAGVSAEEVDTGLLLGLQIMAHGLVFGTCQDDSAQLQAMVITTLQPTVILPKLRDVVRSQVQSKVGQASNDIDRETRRHLSQISISRVFDIEGLWEVLNELGASRSQTDSVPDAVKPTTESEAPPSSQPRAPSPPATKLPPLRTEILDSEDEEGLSSSSSPSDAVSSPEFSKADPAQTTGPHAPARTGPAGEEERLASRVPDLILVTHFSTLLTNLFVQRDKPSAHNYLQLLASHLRYLTRSAGPLVLLLNSTTSSASAAAAGAGVPPPPAAPMPAVRALEPTLRSVFNPPALSDLNYAGGAAGLALSRRNKPAFGMTFTQFLDVHLLCTRVPRTRPDAEALFAPPGETTAAQEVRYATVVEVLLDDVGVWDAAGTTRRFREQRWAAVDVRQGGVRIADAFSGYAEKQQAPRHEKGAIRLAAGFGGPRV